MAALGDAAKGKLGAFVRKASSALKQGSSKLVDGLRSRGEPREDELAATALHRRSTSAGNMQRLSAGPSGGPLHRPSPSAGSIGGTGGGMRTSGSNSSLHSLQRSSAGPRSSAAVAALELQATKADVFFRDDGDDADSLASEGSYQDAGGSSSARGGPAAHDRVHPPGPLESGTMTRNRSFTSLFRTSPSLSASSIQHHQQQQQEQQQRQQRQQRQHYVGSSRNDTAAMPALISLASGKEGAAGSMVNVAAAAGAAASQPLLPASPVKTQPALDAEQQWAAAFTNQYSPLGSALLHQLTTIKSEGSLEWATFASAASEGEVVEAAAAAAAAHSPMGQAVAGRAGAAAAAQQQPAHRHTNSSLQSKLSVTADAFSGLVIDAATDAEQQIVRRSSTQEHASAPASAAASPRQQPQPQAAVELPLARTPQRKLSTTVSWGDWASAWDGVAAGPGNGSGLPTITEGGAAASGEGGVRHSRSQSAL